MTSAVVHLVRHGEVHNPGHVLYGRLPGYHLSEAGRAMAVATAEALADRDITVIRSSPLERAQETAAPLAARLGLEVGVEERLLESDNVFEGTAGGWRKPANWRHLYNPFRPSWGEPYRAVADRVLAACADAAEAAAGHEAVLVSHQAPIWVARLAAQGERLWHRPDRRECALGSVTSFGFLDGRIVEVSYREPAGSVGRRTVGGA